MTDRQWGNYCLTLFVYAGFSAYIGALIYGALA